jgi:hypothetical protein
MDQPFNMRFARREKPSFVDGQLKNKLHINRWSARRSRLHVRVGRRQGDMEQHEPDISDPEQLGGRSARVLGTVISWTFAIINRDGKYPKLDPNFVVDRQTLKRVGRVMCVYSARPLIYGATFLLELLARLLLLIIFLALSVSPSHRTSVVKRERGTLQSHLNSVRR